MKMSGFEKLFVNRERKGVRNFQQLRRLLDRIDVRDARHALELGCGIGSVSVLLADEYGLDVTGTDLDPAQIARARSLYAEDHRVRFRVEDATRLSFPDQGFDLVVAQNTFHHVPDWPRAVREVARVLRPGGSLVWCDFALAPLLVRLLGPLRDRAGLYSLAEMETSFARHDLALLAREGRDLGVLGHYGLVLRRPGASERAGLEGLHEDIDGGETLREEGTLAGHLGGRDVDRDDAAGPDVLGPEATPLG